MFGGLLSKLADFLDEVASEANDTAPDLGGVQLWEDGPYWAESNAGAARPEQYGMLFSFKDAQSALTGPWRLPMRSEFRALLKNCKNTWDRNYNNTGVEGYVFEGKGVYSSNSIFLPLAGCRINSDHCFVGRGYYWSANFVSKSIAGWYLGLRPLDEGVKTMADFYGASVRAVR